MIDGTYIKPRDIREDCKHLGIDVRIRSQVTKAANSDQAQKRHLIIFWNQMDLNLYKLLGSFHESKYAYHIHGRQQTFYPRTFVVCATRSLKKILKDG